MVHFSGFSSGQNGSRVEVSVMKKDNEKYKLGSLPLRLSQFNYLFMSRSS